MKRSVFFGLAISIVIFIVSSSTMAQDGVIQGCYQKNNGQLRIVSSSDECRPSENPISWTSGTQQPIYSSTLYVNGATGQDLPGRGLSEAEPFRTISYAISMVSSLRPTPEKRTTIHVASGNYNEAVYISKDNITLVGAGSDNTFITGNPPSAPNVVEIDSARGVKITGFTLQNGQYGILAKFSNLSCEGNRIKNNNIGIRARRNSYALIKDTIVSNNSGTGIQISNVAAADINYSEIRNNKEGIKVDRSSAAWVEYSQISSNNGIGIGGYIGGNISVGHTDINGNGGPGIHLGAQSVCKLDGHNTITNNLTSTDISPNGGISVNTNSHLLITNDGNGSNEISGNNGHGVLVSNYSSVAISDPGVQINDNRNDGIHLHADSAATFYTEISITGNDGWGLGCSDLAGDSKYSGAEPDLSGNYAGEKSCDRF